jgi:YGGT family
MFYNADFFMVELFAVFPWWVILIDYVLGLVMWTLIGRAAMGFFLPETSTFFFMRFFVNSTDPVIRVFRPITPGFLIPQMVPLYVAWFFFMVRFYLMPWLLGYSVMGMLSFPLESEVAAFIYKIFTPVP